MNKIAPTARIHENVTMGDNCVIEDYVIIGAAPRGKKEGELKTILGNNCYIRSHTVIYSGNKIGDNFQTGNKVNIREENEIGNNVAIGTLSVVEHHVKIEDNVRIHTQAFVPEYCELKKGSWIGPNVVLTNAPFPLSELAKDKLAGSIIGEDAKIGANSTLLPGLNIGKNALVGAGSVVTKDVPENTVVVGNPAKIIKKVDDLQYKTGEKAYK
ncbi:MAG TPA: DapH/DapD/GlmU-related protein [Candidatus Nanoarchaeia archaeon]|nr:DapH/DapD/GlmU-related protein [Candidatus Nanoarchaeia archaeon]